MSVAGRHEARRPRLSDDRDTPSGRSTPAVDRDALTGSHGRASFDAHLPAALGAAGQRRESLTLCVVDLDYFKSVNDAYGHLRGDRVLTEFADRIRRQIRGADQLYRYGGDEFVLLLPRPHGGEALTIVRRLLESVGNTPFGDDPPLWLTATIGTATFPVDAAEPRQLFEQADRRLYEGKRGGRNRAVGQTTVVGHRRMLDGPSRLIEREGELDRVHGFLSELPSQRRGIVAISGPAGVGRTQLLTAAMQAAYLRGYAVLALRGSGDTNRLTDPAGPGGVWSVPAARVTQLATLAQTLEQICQDPAQMGAVIAIDDLERFEAAHLARVREVFESTGVASLALVYTTAVEAPQPLPITSGFCERLELRPLSRTGVQVWLRSVLRTEPPADFLQEVYDDTHGLPARLHMSLTGLVERGVLRPTTTGGWAIEGRALPSAQVSTATPRAGSPAGALPRPLTEVIGRDAETEAVRQLLVRRRLVTLVGPGGIGKTRLSLRVAWSLAGEFPDGAWFVPLAAVQDPDLVVATIAQSLGIVESPDLPLQQRLMEALADRHMLLVLDNFEQLTDAAPLVTELLAAAPGVTALVTSRERLHVYGEQLYPVPPLAVPDLGLLPDAAALAVNPAVALFTARAQAIYPEFELTGENARQVAELCAGLDGLPLAIELAAARTAEFTVAELRSQLNDRLALLSDGPRDLPARQQTLRAAIDWSYERLSPEDRQTFRDLAIFSGGWSPDAAAAVVGSDDQDEQSIPDCLARLVDKSLIRREILPRGDRRYSMLDTIRDYGLDRLEAVGALVDVAHRHARYYLSVAETAEPELRHGVQELWLDRLETEHDNLRAALRWVLNHGQDELAGRLGAALWRFWSVRNHVSEGRRWLGEIGARGASLERRSHAQLLVGAGVLAWIQGDYDEATSRLKQSLEIGRHGRYTDVTATALNALGLVARQQAAYDLAQRYFEESRATWETLNDGWGMAVALGNLGRTALQQGDVERAWELTRMSLELRRELQDHNGLVLGLYTLGLAMLERGDAIEAASLLNEGLRTAQELDDRRLVATTLNGLGRIAREQGDVESAARHYREALQLWRDLEHKEGIAESLEGIADVLGTSSDPARAGRLYAAAEALRSRVGAPVPSSSRAAYRESVAAAHQQLDAAAWDEARSSGCAMSLEAVIAEALRRGDRAGMTG